MIVVKPLQVRRGPEAGAPRATAPAATFAGRGSLDREPGRAGCQPLGRVRVTARVEFRPDRREKPIDAHISTRARSSASSR